MTAQDRVIETLRAEITSLRARCEAAEKTIQSATFHLDEFASLGLVEGVKKMGDMLFGEARPKQLRAERKVRALEAALKMYGEHRASCTFGAGNEACDCGLNQIMFPEAALQDAEFCITAFARRLKVPESDIAALSSVRAALEGETK